VSVNGRRITLQIDNFEKWNRRNIDSEKVGIEVRADNDEPLPEKWTHSPSNQCKHFDNGREAIRDDIGRNQRP
jgi:hypothetical protein